MAKLEVMTLENLTQYDGLIKDYIEESVKVVDDKVGTNTTDITTMKSQIGALQAGTYDDSELRGMIVDKADKSTTLSGYGITDAYTKTEVDTAIANAEHLKRNIVTTLPDVADADVHTIYMVEITDGFGNQKYEEFMLIDGVFEKIGDSAVDLTDYATKTEVSTTKSEANAYSDGLNIAMDTRVTSLENLVGEGFSSISEDSISALFV